MTNSKLGGGFNDLGLSELLSDFNKVPVAGGDQTPQHDQLRFIPVEQMQSGKYQPRKDMNFESLQELADSIKSQGVIQPIVIRKLAADKYEIIAGERRWRAAQLAGLTKVPTVIKDVSDEATIAMALIENIQREDLNPIEEAEAMQRLITEFQMTHHDVATTVGRSRASVTNILRLLNLPLDIRKMIEHGDLEMGHGRAMLTLPEEQQINIAKEVVAKGLSVRETEQLVNRFKQTGQQAISDTEKPSPTITTSASNALSQYLKTTVNVRQNKKGGGQLVIRFKSTDELERLMQQIASEESTATVES